MKTDRWQRVDRLLEAALDLEPRERAAFLERSSEGDEALRREVEELLEAHERAAGDFLATPALEVAALAMAGEQSGSLVGRRLGAYRVLALVARGGMGEIYLAEDGRLRRKVALKLLPPAFTHDSERVRRFEQEARAASMLNHPNIVTIFEVGREDGTHFMATEFVEGEPLRQHLARGRMSMREILETGIQVAGALAAAHAAGIVHRDVKPENLMMRPDGYVKVLDFGVAKLTEQQELSVDADAITLAKVETGPGMVLGTVAYMSPEQLRGTSVDARSDIFSLGVVLYEMIAGRRPFEGETASDVMAAILKTEPPPLAHAELEYMLRKALRKDRDMRYQHVKDLLIDLKRALELATKTEHALQSGPLADAVATTGKAGARTTATAERSVDRRIGQGKVVALALAALVPILAAAAYFTAVAPRPRAITSVAILPFANASGDVGLDYLSDGVSESLIDRLSRLSRLKVVAHNSSSKYRGREADLQEVARALGVEAIVTGRVVRRGDGLTVRAELVDARDGTQIWGEQYRIENADLQKAQVEIARAISERLQVHLTGTQPQQEARHPTENPEAYQLYLNGLYYQRKAGPENFKIALDYYNRAIALDPDFALARAEAAWVYLRSPDPGDPHMALAKAKALATKALELDETLAQAHAVLGSVAMDEWDWAGARREFKRAIELNPNHAGARTMYAFYLSSMARHTEALAEIDRAQELDPLNLHRRSHKGAILLAARRYDEAIQHLQSFLELEPDHRLTLGRLEHAFLAKGMFAEVIATHQLSPSGSGAASSRVALGYAYAMSGRRQEALALLDELKTAKDYVSPYSLAVLHVALGDADGAFACLERAYAAHDPALQDLKIEMLFDPLSSDPRFTDLQRRVGLAS